MRALLLGSGGRESALAWALARAVTIDELVDLAKAFSTEDSGRFIHGILGRVAQEHR